jgi:hypothetical protein
MSQRVRSFLPATGSLCLAALLAACGASEDMAQVSAESSRAKEADSAEDSQERGGFLRVEAAETKEPDEAAARPEPVAEAPREETNDAGRPPAETVEPSPASTPREPEAAAERGAVATTPEESPEERAAGLLQRGDYARAARAYSDLLLAQLDAGGEDRARLTRLAAELARAQAGHRWSRRGTWPSFDLVVESGDSLIAIRKRALAQRPELLLCTGMIERANELPSSTSIRPKDVLRIPSDRPSLLVDLSARWAFYRLGEEVAAAWEVGVGRQGKETPTGVYTIGLKQENPMWSPVGREPVPFGAPENPLGTRWLEWYRDGARTGIGFHGTNDAATVGQSVSEGCIRLRNAEVEVLYAIAPLGAEVRVQP